MIQLSKIRLSQNLSSSSIPVAPTWTVGQAINETLRFT
jgi:hypothetical protein